LLKISKYLEVLTKAEGLPNHYEAVRGRLEWKKIGLKKK
jgi:hypothetical protein